MSGGRETHLLWWVHGATYGMQRCVPRPGGEWWLLKQRCTATLNHDLFARESDAIRAAEANLQQMALDAGVSTTEMRDRLIRSEVPS